MTKHDYHQMCQIIGEELFFSPILLCQLNDYPQLRNSIIHRLLLSTELDFPTIILLTGSQPELVTHLSNRIKTSSDR